MFFLKVSKDRNGGEVVDDSETLVPRRVLFDVACALMIGEILVQGLVNFLLKVHTVV